MKLFKALLISLGIVLSTVVISVALAMTFVFLGYIWFFILDIVLAIVGFTCLIYSSMRDREKLKKELEEINND